jgi:hypothetical protein
VVPHLHAAGRPRKVDPDDLYAQGGHRGGINERWFSSTTNADNGPGTPPDEGLSYVHLDAGQRLLLKDAVEEAGDLLIGSAVMARDGGWNLLCKFFDNLGPIPHHLHQRDEDAARVGRRGKPEAYYFPPQYNQLENHFPYTFMGLEPGTTRADVRRCLENWNTGDNGILFLSRAFRLQPGTGWQVDPGILHAPGSLVTYEPQVNSDVFAMFQSEVEGASSIEPADERRAAAARHDLDYIINARLGRERQSEFARAIACFRRRCGRPRPSRTGIASRGGYGARYSGRSHRAAQAHGDDPRRRLQVDPHSGLRTFGPHSVSTPARSGSGR